MAGTSDTPVTPKLRSAIKVAGQVAQISRLVSLLPTPQDFATKIAGDIIYMSGLVQQLVKDINKVLEGYSNIPYDYFNNQLISISTSAQNTLNRAQEYTNYIVNNTLGLAGDFTEIGKELYEGTIKISAKSAQTVSSFGAAIASTSEDIKGNHDVAESIRSGVKKFEESKYTDTSFMADALKSVRNTENKAYDFIDKTSTGIGNSINSGTQFIQDIIKQLKSLVDKLNKDIDSAFGHIISKNNISSTLGTVSELNGDYTKAVSSQVVGASAAAIKSIVDNFSIGKFITAFTGVVTNATLIKLGLDKLPPINFDKMLLEFQSKMQNNPLDGLNSDITFDDLVKYDPVAYKNLQESFEVYLKQQREDILKKKKNIFSAKLTDSKILINASKNFYNGMSKEERNKIKSAIREIQKKRNQTKKAKTSKKYKDIVLDELKKLQEQCKKFADRLKKSWDAMIQEYKDAVNQVKTFFTGGGPADIEIEELCLDINDNCDNIVQLCTIDMPTQVAGSSTKAILPYCFGMAVPNFAHNMISFVVDVKIILKFIMDLLKYVMNILKDIKKLALYLLVGIRKLKDIILQLLDLLGLGWLMDLVKDITNLFQQKVNETCEILEGTLTPVYLKDLNIYPDMLNEVKKYVVELENKNKVNSDDNKNKIGKAKILKKSTITDTDKINEQLNQDPNKLYEKFIDEETYTNKSNAIYEKLGLTKDTGYINGLLVMMGVDPIDLEEETSNGWTYWITESYGMFLDGFYDCPTSVNVRKIKYNDYAIINVLKERISQIESHDSIYIAAYKSPHFSRDGISYSKNSKDLNNYDDINFSINTDYDPSKIDGWIYYHPNLNFYGYDIVGRVIRGNLNNKIYYNKLHEVDDEMKTKYLTFMENAASKPNNEWISKVIVKPYPMGYWSGLNINGDTSISASEAFYWFNLVVDDNDDFDGMYNPDITPGFQDLFGDDDDDDNDDEDTPLNNGCILKLNVKSLDTNTKNVSGISLIKPNSSTISYRDTFNVSKSNHIKTKVWDNIFSDNSENFTFKCVGYKTGGGIKNIHTKWKFKENANCVFNYYGVNFEKITSGEFHNTSFKNVKNINSPENLNNDFIEYSDKNKIIWNNCVIDTDTISILTNENTNEQELWYYENGIKTKNLTNEVLEFDGEHVKFNDNLYMYNDILIYHDTEHSIRVYGDSSANVVDLSNCISNISNDNNIKIDVDILLEGYTKDDITTGGDKLDYTPERTYKGQILVNSKTSRSVFGKIEYTIKGNEYTLSKTKSGNTLDESKTWDYIPYDIKTFDVQCIGSKIGSDINETKIKTHWVLQNGKYMYNNYEIHNGYKFNYLDFKDTDISDNIIKNYQKYDTYTDVDNNINYYTDKINEIIIVGNTLYEFNIENANVVNLLNCQLININDEEDVNIITHIEFDGDDISDNKNDDTNKIVSEIVDRTIDGSVIKINDNGVVKYVFVKNQIVKDGDWILVNGKYYQAKLPK